MSNKAIYQPKGKAAEYAAWACNLFNGCSNGCSYCYLRRGVLAHVMGGNRPVLKSCFLDNTNALSVFVKELKENIEELRRHGLFFSFSTDPMLPEERQLTWACVSRAVREGVNVQILTKRADIFDDVLYWLATKPQGASFTDRVAWGFTLTGLDDLEPGASTNAERIDAMARLHAMGFRTFTSLEPVVDPGKTMAVYRELIRRNCCDLVKVGLQSGRKEPYGKEELAALHDEITGGDVPVYLKRSLTDYLGLPPDERKDVFGT